MIYRAKAPLRLSFSGGGTDVPPYPQRHGGLVLTSTIDRFAYASLTPRDDGQLSVESLDYDLIASYRTPEELALDGKLDLVKAVVQYMQSGMGAHLLVRSDAPPGTGLGSSSAMVVALIGVLADWLRKPKTFYEIADDAVTIERKSLGIKGGYQDQYASCFGGFNLIEFYGDKTIVVPLRIPDQILNELQLRLLMVYTGKTRLSGNIIARQQANYERGEADIMDALHRLKALTLDMKNALLRGKLDDIGEIFHETWQNKQKLAEGISNDEIEGLYAAARRAGAQGGKILGAGGGGYLLLCCRFEDRHRVRAEMERLGCSAYDFSFIDKGLQTWQC